jgi:hypothetical protein
MSKLSNKKTIIKKWVAALKSGDYLQGRGKLHYKGRKDGKTVDKFCCLGVLCDLAVKAKIIPEPTSEYSKTFYYSGERFELPISVQRWAGVSSDGRFDGGDLINLNDSKKKTFEQIADIIASKPEGLFKKEGK